MSFKVKVSPETLAELPFTILTVLFNDTVCGFADRLKIQIKRCFASARIIANKGPVREMNVVVAHANAGLFCGKQSFLCSRSESPRHFTDPRRSPLAGLSQATKVKHWKPRVWCVFFPDYQPTAAITALYGRPITDRGRIGEFFKDQFCLGLTQLLALIDPDHAFKRHQH